MLHRASVLRLLLWLGNTLLCMCISFTGASTDGHRGGFHFRDIADSTAVNIHVRVFVWTVFLFLLDVHLGVE